MMMKKQSFICRGLLKGYLLLPLGERPDLSPERGRRRAEFLREDCARLELEGVSACRVLRVAAQQALRGAGSPLKYVQREMILCH